MFIYEHRDTGVFHLQNAFISYIFKVMDGGALEHLYYGKRVHDCDIFHLLHEEKMRSCGAVCLEEPSIQSLEFTPNEFPVYGTGDFKTPAIGIKRSNGSLVSSFVYDHHVVYDGKKELESLPSLYATEDEAMSLEVVLKDSLLNLELTLSYTIFKDLPVVVRSSRIVNHGVEDVCLDRLLSSSLDFKESAFEMIDLVGAWGRERYVERFPLRTGIQGVQSLRGASSAEANPFMALVRKETTESQGEAYGFNLVYSGNFLAQVEVSSFALTRVSLGIHPEMFAWDLKAGSSFESPEAVCVYSDCGLNGMSHAFHALYKGHISRSVWANRERPILLNNWEGTEFDFTEEKILAMAKKASDVGAELFVLDDGWFGVRNNDRAGLGDWFVNYDKLPSGIDGLSKKIEAMGLKFGLWIEPEMVNKDSDLYRSHPDYIVGDPERFESHSRHQHVLDFSKKEVVDCVYEMLIKVFDTAAISYVKWDMNRYITEPYSKGHDGKWQGEFMHRYMLGVYELYERLTKRYPHILFESCASGGARFDAGLLKYAPQAWTSDDTDAYERTKIQYGTSLVYPVSMMSAHVSAVPNHQLNRMTPLVTRGNMAFFGAFGYELDLNLLSEEEISIVKKQIQFMKQYRSLIQLDGKFYRLLSPFETGNLGQIVVSSDQKEAVCLYVQGLNTVNGSWLRFKLDGLDADCLYKVTYHSFTKDEEVIGSFYGDYLMRIGLVIERDDLTALGGDFASMLFTLKAEVA